MDFYLVYENGAKGDEMPLGTHSFGFFYPDTGFDFLTDIADKKPELIKFIKIITERGMTYTVEDFLNLFEGENRIQIRRSS